MKVTLDDKPLLSEGTVHLRRGPGSTHYDFGQVTGRKSQYSLVFCFLPVLFSTINWNKFAIYLLQEVSYRKLRQGTANGRYIVCYKSE